MELTRYTEKRSWNPLSPSVSLTEHELRVGTRRLPLGQLRLVAIAEAWLRGAWVGGGGSERPLAALPADRGTVPVIRASGTAQPLKVREAARFAAALGELAVRHCGGADAVREAGRLAAAEGVPLWIARRWAPGPHGRPVWVAVDRRLVRADVWTEGAPPVRLRGPHGWSAEPDEPVRGLTVTVGEWPATLGATLGWRKSRRSVSLAGGGSGWRLTRDGTTSGRLLRDGRPVALLSRPEARETRVAEDELLPLARVRYESSDPLDAALAHLFGVAFGLGDATGTVRFGTRRPQPEPDEPETWELPWFTGLRPGRDDSGPGASGDAWSDNGNGGAEGGGSDGGGGGFFGGDGGGSGGDGGSGGGDGGGGGGD